MFISGRSVRSLAPVQSILKLCPVWGIDLRHRKKTLKVKGFYPLMINGQPGCIGFNANSYTYSLGFVDVLSFTGFIYQIP
jgi:hypothetical protein